MCKDHDIHHSQQFLQDPPCAPEDGLPGRAVHGLAGDSDQGPATYPVAERKPRECPNLLLVDKVHGDISIITVGLHDKIKKSGRNTSFCKFKLVGLADPFFMLPGSNVGGILC